MLAGPAAVKLAERMVKLGPEWMEALERAATLGDEAAILRLASQAGATDPWLGNEISRLGSKFDHDSILYAIYEARRLSEDGTNG
jgi:hypothetical protein